MRRRFFGSSLAVLALVGAAAPALSAQEPFNEPGFTLERQENLHQVPAGSTVKVANAFGDVRLRFGGYEGQVEVRAVLQQFSSEGPPLALHSKGVDGGVEIEVGMQAADAGSWIVEPVKGQRKRADLVIFVPQGVAVEVGTGGGQIDARGLKSDLEARTASGAIYARSISGDLDLSSDSGAIVAVPEARAREHVQRLTSRSGDLTVYLFEQGSFAVDARTAGRLTTDFSLTVEEDAANPRRKLGKAIVGSGGTPIQLDSATGEVRLLLKPSAERAAPDGDEGLP